MANHAAADQSPTDPTGCHRPIWLQLPGAALGVLTMALFAMGWQHLRVTHLWVTHLRVAPSTSSRGWHTALDAGRNLSYRIAPFSSQWDASEGGVSHPVLC